VQEYEQGSSHPYSFLLPHERLWANYVAYRQATHGTSATAKLQANYGPEGVRALAASLVDFAIAWLIAITAILRLWRMAGDIDPLTLGLLVVVASLAILTWLRCFQVWKLGRAWRNGRPYQK
jgi:hypothetical protein